MPAIRLTSELQATICAFIRAGGFPHIAAEAAGVPQPVFTAWLERGRTSKTGRCRRFHDAILQAQAQARLAAETRALQKNPLTWLKSGPGRETESTPGWTTPGKPQFHEQHEPLNLLQHPETQELLATLLRLLQPFPEARSAVAQALLALQATPAKASS